MPDEPEVVFKLRAVHFQWCIIRSILNNESLSKQLFRIRAKPLLTALCSEENQTYVLQLLTEILAEIRAKTDVETRASDLIALFEFWSKVIKSEVERPQDDQLEPLAQFGSFSRSLLGSLSDCYYTTTKGRRIFASIALLREFDELYFEWSDLESLLKAMETMPFGEMGAEEVQTHLRFLNAVSEELLGTQNQIPPEHKTMADRMRRIIGLLKARRTPKR